MIGFYIDFKGNVYVGVGDGVYVFSLDGFFIGKIYFGEIFVNFNFVGYGCMVICVEIYLYYVMFGVLGWDFEV